MLCPDSDSIGQIPSPAAYSWSRSTSSMMEIQLDTGLSHVITPESEPQATNTPAPKLKRPSTFPIPASQQRRIQRRARRASSLLHDTIRRTHILRVQAMASDKAGPSRFDLPRAQPIASDQSSSSVIPRPRVQSHRRPSYMTALIVAIALGFTIFILQCFEMVLYINTINAMQLRLNALQAELDQAFAIVSNHALAPAERHGFKGIVANICACLS
ncbi:hypothetical protein EJ08DRAFT_703441 [Tothia fuscella]|uniref:Uncharacterized protein n=1 Tax=Tothia fuscella TaxID=1048955 RepID=A0A9P4NEE9_9PEZI|nr:hypothetical protein EJ08DRAFT_703441 [Tothia fuscella]